MSLITKKTETRKPNAVVEGKISNSHDESSEYDLELDYIISQYLPIPLEGIGTLFDGKYEYVLFGILNGEPDKKKSILGRKDLELRLPHSPGIIQNLKEKIDARSIFMDDGRVFINRRDLRDISYLNKIFSEKVATQIKRRLDLNNR